eukprot:tig00000571_g2179.t1
MGECLRHSVVNTRLRAGGVDPAKEESTAAGRARVARAAAAKVKLRMAPGESRSAPVHGLDHLHTFEDFKRFFPELGAPQHGLSCLEDVACLERDDYKELKMPMGIFRRLCRRATELVEALNRPEAVVVDDAEPPPATAPSGSATPAPSPAPAPAAPWHLIGGDAGAGAARESDGEARAATPLPAPAPAARLALGEWHPTEVEVAEAQDEGEAAAPEAADAAAAAPAELQRAPDNGDAEMAEAPPVPEEKPRRLVVPLGPFRPDAPGEPARVSGGGRRRGGALGLPSASSSRRTRATPRSSSGPP